MSTSTDRTLAAYSAAFHSPEYKAAEAVVRGHFIKVSDLERRRAPLHREARAKVTVLIKAARKELDLAMAAKEAVLARLMKEFMS